MALSAKCEPMRTQNIYVYTYVCPYLATFRNAIEAMEVRYFASGATGAVLDADEFEGQTAKAVKQILAPKVGVTRFKQRLFVEDGSREIPDDEVFDLAVTVQLVILEFCPHDAEEQNKMISASEENDTVALEKLLQCPRNPDETGTEGRTALIQAAAHGHVQPTLLLLEAGAKTHTTNLGGRCPLWAAAAAGHLDIVRLLLEAGAAKDQPDNIGSTPLHAAASEGHLDIVRLLVELGAAKDAPNNHGLTPLHAAASIGHLHIVGLLVELGALKDQPDNHGTTPLYVAASEGHLDIVRLLAEVGAAKDAPNTVVWHLC